MAAFGQGVPGVYRFDGWNSFFIKTLKCPIDSTEMIQIAVHDEAKIKS